MTDTTSETDRQRVIAATNEEAAAMGALSRDVREIPPACLP
jgi:hypothetical protein